MTPPDDGRPITDTAKVIDEFAAEPKPNRFTRRMADFRSQAEPSGWRDLEMLAAQGSTDPDVIAWQQKVEAEGDALERAALLSCRHKFRQQFPGATDQDFDAAVAEHGAEFFRALHRDGCELVAEPIDAIEQAKAAKADTFAIPSRKELRAKKPAGLLYPELYLPRLGLGAIVGFSGDLKSFIALDLLASVCTGIPFLGKYAPRKLGSAIYFAGETQEDLEQNRIPAWELEHAKELEKLGASLDDTLGVFPGVPNAFNMEDRDRFKRAIERWANKRHSTAPLRVVAFDTWNKMMPGQDENDPGAAAVVQHFAEDLKHEFGLLALFIHHMGKDRTRGARGTTAFLAGMDWQLDCIEKFYDLQSQLPALPGDPTIAHYIVRKTKGRGIGESIHIRAQNIDLPNVRDDDGEVVLRASAVLHHINRDQYDAMAAPMRKRAKAGADTAPGDNGQWARLPGLVERALAGGGTVSTKELIASLKRLGDDLIDSTAYSTLRKYLTGHKGDEALKTALDAYASKDPSGNWRWAYVETGQEGGDDE
ncbi:MAG TPA: AAA family ATPase [Stellaceae bacterium]|nr:AAA family ATPase [Stellaceae bacterium]